MDRPQGWTPLSNISISYSTTAKELPEFYHFFHLAPAVWLCDTTSLCLSMAISCTVSSHHWKVFNMSATPAAQAFHSSGTVRSATQNDAPQESLQHHLFMIPMFWSLSKRLKLYGVDAVAIFNAQAFDPVTERQLILLRLLSKRLGLFELHTERYLLPWCSDLLGHVAGSSVLSLSSK